MINESNYFIGKHTWLMILISFCIRFFIIIVCTTIGNVNDSNQHLLQMGLLLDVDFCQISYNYLFSIAF